MKKIKLMLALVLGLMCVMGTVAPAKAAEQTTPSTVSARASRYANTVGYVGSYRFDINYYIGTGSTGVLSQVYVSSWNVSPSTFSAVSVSNIQKVNSYQWYVTFRMEIRDRNGLVLNTGSKTVTVNSAPI